MATFVQLGESDPAFDLLRVINHINDVKMTDEEFQKDPMALLIKEQKYGDFIEKAFFSIVDKLLASNPDQIDFAFSLAFSLLHSIQVDRLSKIISKFAEILSQDTTNSILKLRLLLILFNLLENPSLRHNVLVRIMTFAISSGNAQRISHHMGSLKEWATEWELAAKDTRALFLLGSELCAAAEMGDGQRKYQKQYLRSLNKVKGKELEAAVPTAASAVLSSLQSATLEDCSFLLSLDAVQQLKGHKEHSQLFELLAIFVECSVDEYTKWAENKSNLVWLGAHGLDHETSVQQMRTLTVCSMGEAKECLTYAEIKERLSLPDLDAVEMVVIEAVVSKKMDARMDQDAEVVYVQRSQPRKFDSKTDWNSLNAKLEACKNNVNSVLVNMPVAHAPMDQFHE